MPLDLLQHDGPHLVPGSQPPVVAGQSGEQEPHPGQQHRHQEDVRGEDEVEQVQRAPQLKQSSNVNSQVEMACTMDVLIIVIGYGRSLGVFPCEGVSGQHPPQYVEDGRVEELGVHRDAAGRSAEDELHRLLRLLPDHVGAAFTEPELAQLLQ